MENQNEGFVVAPYYLMHIICGFCLSRLAEGIWKGAWPFHSGLMTVTLFKALETVVRKDLSFLDWRVRRPNSQFLLECGEAHILCILGDYLTMCSLPSHGSQSIAAQLYPLKNNCI